MKNISIKNNRINSAGIFIRTKLFIYYIIIILIYVFPVVASEKKIRADSDLS